MIYATLFSNFLPDFIELWLEISIERDLVLVWNYEVTEVVLFASFISCVHNIIFALTLLLTEICSLVFHFCVTMVDIIKDPFSMLASYF